MHTAGTPTLSALERDPQGRLVLLLADGSRHEGVTPVRAHPLTDPRHGIALVGPDGHERCWLADLDALAPALRTLLEQALAEREFTPTITRLVSVSTFATPSTWTVETDRGVRAFVLKGEEDVRRLDGRALLVTDADGVCYRIADRFALDRASRRLLERFL
jgi:hypothetical protein